MQQLLDHFDPPVSVDRIPVSGEEAISLMLDVPSNAISEASAPLVTVALRAFNSRQFIRGALDGAVAQTYRPLEIVVCDDGSTDGTHTEIERYLAEFSTEIPIRFVRHNTNLGVGAALDTIVANSRGEYLMIADGDDISLPGRAAECIDTVRRMGPGCLGVACQGQCIDPNGKELGGQIEFHQEGDLKAGSIARGGGLKGGMSLLSRRVFQAGPPLCGLRQQEDRLLGYRAACLGELVTIPKTLLLRRLHTANISNYSRLHRSSTQARVQVSDHFGDYVRAVARMIKETNQLRSSGALSSIVGDECIKHLRRELRILRLYRAAMHPRMTVRVAALLALLRRGVTPRAIGRVYVHAHLPRVGALLLWRHDHYRRASQARCGTRT
jgi:glycosyltransferase involved in cell wall biosynthesis